MKTTAVPGTVSAFFWFRNDSQEIDMEMLSANFNASSNPIYLVMQTPQSVLNGYNAAGTSTFEAKQLPFVPTAEFHEYRFDWTTDGVAFYADGRWLDFMNWTYPTAPGYLTINHWSNGNAYWGGGPPLVPAVTNISYVKAYFNSSDPTRQAEFARACPVLDEGKICEILDQVCLGQYQCLEPLLMRPDLCALSNGRNPSLLHLAWYHVWRRRHDVVSDSFDVASHVNHHDRCVQHCADDNDYDFYAVEQHRWHDEYFEQLC